MPNPPDTDLALASVSEALDALLVALVALGGDHDVEVPVEALDAALRTDGAYQEARGAFSTVFTDLGDVLGRDALWFELEEKHNAVVSAGTDVGFKLGLAIAVMAKE